MYVCIRVCGYACVRAYMCMCVLICTTHARTTPLDLAIANSHFAIARKLDLAEQELEEKMSLWNILTNQHKKQDAELRQAKRTLVSVNNDKAKTAEEMNELQLQNEILQQMMNKTTREKEEVLVHHDVMKLEVSRLRTKMTARTEQVFALENRKQQLQLSMQEREKEVEVRSHRRRFNPLAFESFFRLFCAVFSISARMGSFDFI